MLTLRDCGEHIRSALGGGMDPSFPVKTVVGQAGSWFCKAHSWRFLVKPPVHLNLRATITVTAATWIESTRTLTITSPASALASYAFLEGDEFELTAGTNATVGFYQVAARLTAANFSLRTSIGATANGSTDIAGTLSLPAVALPPDFGEMIGDPVSTNLSGAFAAQAGSDVVAMRPWGGAGTSPFYAYTITFGDATGTYGGAPVPRLELDRSATTALPGSIWMLYRAKFVPPSDDMDRIRVPDYCEPAFIRAVRAFARGWEEEDAGTLGPRLAELKLSPEFTDAVSADGGITRTVGPMRGGAAAAYHTSSYSPYRRDVVVDWP